MADNYTQFSEIIANLSAQEEQFLVEQLEPIAIVDGVKHPYDLGEGRVVLNSGETVSLSKAQFAGCRAYRRMPGYDKDFHSVSAGFECEFCDGSDDPDGNGRHLWLHADDNGDLELAAYFVQQFLRRCRPDQCWSLTYATTCSKPRAGEFGGGAIFVTAKSIQWQNSHEFIAQRRRRFEAKHPAKTKRRTAKRRGKHYAIR